MSNRIIVSSLPNMKLATALVNSVFPTPVGPAKIKLAIGLRESRIPTRARFTAFETASTACS